MGTYWYAINFDNMTYFEAPSEFGFNKSYHVHNPENIFPHMFVYMNEKPDSIFDQYELKSDEFKCVLNGKEWNDFKNITEDVQKEYLEFWRNNGMEFKSQMHYDNLNEEQIETINNLSDKAQYIRDTPIDKTGKPIEFKEWVKNKIRKIKD